MKWLAATALTTALVTGFFMFEGGVAQVALAGPATIQLAQNSSTTGTSSTPTPSTGASSMSQSQGQGNQPPNVTGGGPSAKAPAQGSAAVSGSTSGRTSSGAATGSTTSSRAAGTSSQMDMSTGTTRSKSTRKSTARAKSADHTNVGSAGAGTRSRSMGTAAPSRSRDSGDRATSALNWLSASGYRDVREIHQQGNMFVATVNKDGRSQQVTVDPASGRVAPAS